MKVAVIHQPDFLPYLGFYHRLIKVDVFILLDHVQFVTNGKNSWTHRDKIKTARGEQWLTVGVKKTALGTPINQVLLANTAWREENLNLVRENYRNAPYFKPIFTELETLYETPSERLVDFTTASLKLLLKLLKINVTTLFSSDLNPSGSKNELLVDLLQKVSATDYLSGVGARNYFDPGPYSSAGLTIHWQQFYHPSYPQQFGEFIPYLSTIDALFNCGVDKTRDMLGFNK